MENTWKTTMNSAIRWKGSQVFWSSGGPVLPACGLGPVLRWLLGPPHRFVPASINLPPSSVFSKLIFTSHLPFSNVYLSNLPLTRLPLSNLSLSNWTRSSLPLWSLLVISCLSFMIIYVCLFSHAIHICIQPALSNLSLSLSPSLSLSLSLSLLFSNTGMLWKA